VRRRHLLLALLALVVGSAVLAQTGSSARGQEGGIFRVGLPTNFGLDTDPALSFSPAVWPLLEVTCARLYTYPDEKSPGSFRLQPEVASGYARSEDLRTYTFTLRRSFHFSNGEPVRASAFKRAINRALMVNSLGAEYFMRDIVGADDVLAGKRKTARGVVARGNTLVVRFTRPAPDFPARTALPFFCAVPPWLPESREGLDRFPSAGPYYVQEYRPMERIKIRRNPYYGGDRKIHLEGFDLDLQGGNLVELLRRIDRGDFDWGPVPGGIFATPGLDFEAKYGRNKSRYWVRPGLTPRLFVFNSSRALFRSNPRLRQAVNFALDRRSLVASSYGPVLNTPTDRLVPHSVPGFGDANVYPFEGDLERARKLARGQLRSGKAVLRVSTFPPLIETAQLVKKQLAQIGLEIEIEVGTLAATADYLAELTRHEAEWDIAFVLWTPNIPDAHTYLNLLLETQLQGGETVTRVHERARAALARAARLPQGRARNLAYAEVDELIARDVAPAAALSVLNEATLVSDRVGCLVLRPALDLAVACLRE